MFDFRRTWMVSGIARNYLVDELCLATLALTSHFRKFRAIVLQFVHYL